jgi:hypothetical protein
MDAADKKTLVQRVAESLGKDESDVEAVLSEFTLQLHRALFEKFEGDYVGQTLYEELPHQAYFHFLGFLERLSEWYGQFHPDTVAGYLNRLGGQAAWRPFAHQMEAWVEFPPPNRDEDDTAEA